MGGPQNLQSELDKLVGPEPKPVSARQPRTPNTSLKSLPTSQPSVGSSNELDRLVGPEPKARPEPLEPPPGRLTDPNTGKTYKDYGPKYGAIPPALYYANIVSQAPGRFAKWLVDKATKLPQQYPKTFEALELPALGASTPFVGAAFGAHPFTPEKEQDVKGLEDEIRPEEYSDLVASHPWLYNTTTLIRHLGRGQAETFADPTTWPFLASGSARPWIRAGIDLGFSALQAHGAVKGTQAAAESFKQGEYWQGTEEGIQAIMQGLFAAGAGKSGLENMRPQATRIWRGMQVADKIAQKDFGKSYRDLSPAQRETVGGKIYDVIRKPAYKKVASDIQSIETLADLHDMVRLQRGEIKELPARLKTRTPQDLEILARVAKEKLGETKAKSVIDELTAPKKAPAVPPSGRPGEGAGPAGAGFPLPPEQDLMAMMEEDNERLRKKYASEIDDLEKRNREKQNAAFRSELLGPDGGKMARERAAYVRERRDAVIKEIDRMIAEAPSKRAAEGDIPLLEGEPKSASQQFDDLVDQYKAEIGNEQADRLKNLNESRSRQAEAFRRDFKDLTSRAMERLDRDDEGKLKVIDKRGLPRNYEFVDRRLQFTSREYEEPALLEGGEHVDPFTQREEEVRKEVEREKARRLQETTAQIKKITAKLVGQARRGLDGLLEKDERELRLGERFNVVDKRGGDRGFDEVPILEGRAGSYEFEPLPQPAAETRAETSAPTEPPKAAPDKPDTKANFSKPSAKAVIGEAVPGVYGRDFQLSIRGKKWKVRAKISPSKHLTPSNDPITFAILPGGIADVKRWGRRLQPRYYENDRVAQGEVAEHAMPNRFEKEKIFVPDPSTGVGPPVGLADGTVMGGNSRDMTAKRMYREGNGKIYYDGLVENASFFGIDPKSIPDIKEEPVLWWELSEPPTDTKELSVLADDLNQKEQKGLSRLQDAVAKGQRWSENSLAFVSGVIDDLGDEATLLEAAGDKSEEIARRMAEDGVFAQQDTTTFVNDEGKLTKAGKDLFVNSVLGRVIDDAGVLERTPPSVLDKITRALPSLLRLMSRGGEWDIGQYMRDVADLVSRASESGKSVEDYMNQKPFEEEGVPVDWKGRFSPVITGLAKFLQETDKPLHVKRQFEGYAAEAKVASQPTLGPTPLPWDSFNEYFKANVDANSWLKMEKAPPLVAEPVKEVVPSELKEAPKKAKKSGKKSKPPVAVEAVEPPPEKVSESRQPEPIEPPPADIEQPQAAIEPPPELSNLLDATYQSLPGLEGALPEKVETPPDLATPENVNKVSGNIERESPLFRGSSEMPQKDLFAARPSGYGDDNAVVSKDEYEALKKKLGGGGLFVNPMLNPELLVTAAKIGAYHFEAGAREFLKWSNEMVRDLGDRIRPHLRNIWEAMPVEARRQGQRKLQELGMRARPEDIRKVNDRIRAFAEIEKKSVGLVDLTGKEVSTHEEPRKLEPPPPPPAPAKLDGGRVDAPPELQEPVRTGPVDAKKEGRPDAGRSPSVKPDEPRAGGGRSGSPEPAGRKGGRGSGKARTPVEPIPDVAAAKLEPQKITDRPPVVDEDHWKNQLWRWKLPKDMPPPTTSLMPWVEAKLRPWQIPMTQRVVSTLMDNDAVVLAAPTGSGKTVMGGAAIVDLLNRMGDKAATANVLVLTPSRSLGKKWIASMKDLYGLEAERLPSGLSQPEKPGIYTITYASAIRREGIENFPWDIMVADESHRARKWYTEKAESKGVTAAAHITTGMMVRQMGAASRKAIFISATPFHTPLEMGYLEKLGLWKPGQFADWAKQFGVQYTEQGWVAPANPVKLAKLWQQLVADGRLVGQERDMSNHEVNFAIVPASPEGKEGVRNIVRAFRMAVDHFNQKGRIGLRNAALAHAVSYVKAFLERERIPAVVELMKKAMADGWHPVVFTETKSAVDEVYDFLKPVDEELGGELSRMMPKLKGVEEQLKQAFGNDLAVFTGSDSPERQEELKAFQSGKKKVMVATYAAGAEGVDMHDTVGDAPRAGFYLGPPWSGMVLDQGLGRLHRDGSKSRAWSLFVGSNAAPEIKLLVGKVAPRLEQLRAAVHGIEKGDPLAKGLRNLADVIDYMLSAENTPKFDQFNDFLDTRAVANYKDVAIPSAKDSMNKSLQMERLEPPPESAIVKPGANATVPPDLKQPTPGGGGVKLYSGLDPEEVMKALRQTAEDVKTVAGKVSGAFKSELTGRIEPPSGDIERERLASDWAKFLNERDVRKSLDEALPSIYDREAFAGAEGMVAEVEADDHPENPEGAAIASWRRGVNALKDSGPIGGLGATYRTFLVSGERIIAKIGGEVGKKVNAMKWDYLVRKSNLEGDFYSRLLDIGNKYGLALKDEGWSDVWNVRERGLPARNPDTAAMVREVGKLFDEVADLAKKANVKVEVTERKGGKKYFDFPERNPGYAPHIYDWESIERFQSNKRAQIVKNLKARGMSQQEAEDFLLRIKARDVPLAGNIEKAREFDIQGYEETFDALSQYFRRSAEAIARTETFGQKRGKLEVLLSDIESPEARKKINDIMDTLLVKKPLLRPTQNFINFASDSEMIMKMPFAGATMLLHLPKASMMTNTRSFLSALVDIARDHKEVFRESVQSGASIGTEYLLGDYGATKRRSQKFLKFYTVMSMDRLGRTISDRTARNFLEGYAMRRLLVDPHNPDLLHALKDDLQLRDSDIDYAYKNKVWSEEALRRAGAKVALKSQTAADPTSLPPGWSVRGGSEASEMLGASARVATLLKRYIFRNGEFMRERLIDEAKRGNFKPWIPFLAIGLPYSTAVRALMDLIRGKPKRIEQLFDPSFYTSGGIAFEAAQDLGMLYGAGITTSLVQAMMNHISPQSWAAGPFFGDVANASEAAYNAIDKILGGEPDKAVHLIWGDITRTIPPLRPFYKPERGGHHATKLQKMYGIEPPPTPAGQKTPEVGMMEPVQ